MDGDVERDRVRVSGAVEALAELIERVKCGDLFIADFNVNASVTDPLRMNIDIKTVRGRADAPEVPLRFAKDRIAPKPNVTAARQGARQTERERLMAEAKRIREQCDEWDAANNIGLPPGLTARQIKQSGVEWTPRKRRLGARELDLD
jgi:hypothetical protein